MPSRRRRARVRRPRRRRFRRFKRRGRGAYRGRGMMFYKDVEYYNDWLTIDQANLQFDDYNTKTVQLGSFPEATDFRHYYQWYALVRVRVEFLPKNAPQIGENKVFLETAFDPNDANFTTGTLDGYATVRRVAGFRKSFRTHRFKPLTMVYQGPTTTGYASPSRRLTWISTLNSTVQHYGIKGRLATPSPYVSGDVPAKGSYSVRVIATWAFKGRAPRTV